MDSRFRGNDMNAAFAVNRRSLIPQRLHRIHPGGLLLTAAAVVVGASVILFDPIFQGLSLSLMAGEVASTVLSRMADR